MAWFPFIEVAAVDLGEQTEGEHVLPEPRILHDLETDLVHRDFDDPVVRGRELVHGRSPLVLDLLVVMVRPHVLEQNQRVVFQGAQTVAVKKHLLVEGHHEIGAVPPVGDRLAAHPDPDAARARRIARGRLYLRGDDLHRPDPVPRLGGNGPEDLATPLRAFTRIGDDLDRVGAQFEDVELGMGLSVLAHDGKARAHCPALGFTWRTDARRQGVDPGDTIGDSSFGSGSRNSPCGR
jgi:hypothetical protein